ncbi:hypothetical protein ACLUV9_04310 [Limosilactobacillus balticus]|uniref:hypothetical protein n=1 Tax=Limosilactobacillus balticus TaxID=2759747 RepID=UPI0039962D74
MKKQLLKAIVEMPSSAAYYMGQRDGYACKIKDVLNVIPVESVRANDSVLKELYWWLDMYNDSFAREMGWAQ